MSLGNINIGSISVSRLIVGGNPFSGFSHQGLARDAEMVRYFTAQRIKAPKNHDDEDAVNEYLHKLALLHHIQVHAMKAKQSTDLEQIETLRKLVAKFRKAYFGEEGKHEH